MNLKYILSIVVFPFLVGGVTHAYGNDLPHTVILENQTQKYSVLILPEKKQIQVQTIKGSDEIVPYVYITLIDANGKQTNFTLQRVSPDQNLTTYQGKLTPEAQSFIGIELKIPFKNKPSVHLKNSHAVRR